MKKSFFFGIIILLTCIFACNDEDKSLPAPILESPADGSTDVMRFPTFTWAAVPSATKYDFQLSLVEDFSTVVIDYPYIGSPSFPVYDLAPETHYFWRVNASSDIATSKWSEVRDFTTAPLEIPVLVDPADGAADLFCEVTFSWNAIPIGIEYNFQLARDEAFTDIVVDKQNVGALNISVANLEPNTHYFWRVNASTTQGLTHWSEVRGFTTVSVCPS